MALWLALVLISLAALLGFMLGAWMTDAKWSDMIDRHR